MSNVWPNTVDANLAIGPSVPGVPSGGAFGWLPTQDNPYNPSTHVLESGTLSLNLADFGAALDGSTGGVGGVGFTATIQSTTATVTDPNPSSVIPRQGQLVTFIARNSSQSLGGGVASVNAYSSGNNVTVNTNTAHGMTVGQMFTLTGVVGAQLNGTWTTITGTAGTAVVFYNNVQTIGAYSSGGTIRSQTKVFGYVSNPQLSGGTVTFQIVTTPGGFTPVTIPSLFANTGLYYYGSDDIAAWNTAITVAETIVSPSTPVTISWSGTSMVSSTVVTTRNVTLLGDSMDYSTPGDTVNTCVPQRGSILRAHGNFNITTPLLNQFGVGFSASSCAARFCSIDAANVCATAIQSEGTSCNYWSVLACNGLLNSWNMQSNNSMLNSCIGWQQVVGDSLVIGGTDCKVSGPSYYRGHGMSAIHIMNTDCNVGSGCHVLGNGAIDILVDDLNASINSTILAGVIFDICEGPHIRVASGNSTHGITGMLISACSFFQIFTQTGEATYPWPCVQLDSTINNGSGPGNIIGVTMSSYTIFGNANSVYKSIMETVASGNGVRRVVLGDGNAEYCNLPYSLISSSTRLLAYGNNEIGPLVVRTSPANTVLTSTFTGQITITGNGSTTVFDLAHLMGIASNAGAIQFCQSASSSPVGFTAPTVTSDATNIIFTFSSAPTSGSITYNVRAAL